MTRESFSQTRWNVSFLHTLMNMQLKCVFHPPCQFYGAPDLYESMLKYLNIVFTGLFTLECILKIIAFNPLVSRRARVLPNAGSLRTPMFGLASCRSCPTVPARSFDWLIVWVLLTAYFYLFFLPIKAFISRAQSFTLNNWKHTVMHLSFLLLKIV